ncbi:MAG: PKD domain-containing protein, partial [Candidatus Thermoplasmatota archaeon]|nr:PKD domain-containing protein [Candidatus Thermoplasmatota archaeon]
GESFLGEVSLILECGKSNVVVFKAYDIAGNEQISDPRHIWVNSPPSAKITSPADGEYWDDMGPVILNAIGTEDPDGDSLNYTWMLNDDDNPLAHGLVYEVALPAGSYMLTLVVKDDVGAEDRITRTLIVEHNPPRTESRDNDWLFVLLIFIVAVVLSLVYIIRKRSLNEIREDE